jgi:hypothetical protein
MIKYLSALMPCILFASSAYAYIPDGCYATNATGYCWNVNFTAGDCDGYVSSFRVGTLMASACTYINNTEKRADDNYNAFLSAISQRDYNYAGWLECATTLNSATNTIVLINNSFKKQTALVNKLKRACGSKCKNIR